MNGDELSLLINNDGRIYKEYIIPTQKNLARHIVKGEYNVTLANKAWLNLVEAVIKDARFKREIMREFELTSDQVARISMSIKREAAKWTMMHQMSEVDDKFKKMTALKAAGKPWSMKD